MSREIEVAIELDWATIIQLFLLVLVAVALALIVDVRAAPEQAETSVSVARAASVPGRYYLTSTKVDGAGALTACTDGYHMAALWEIADPSELIYDTTLGVTTFDSGKGPPTASSSEYVGWVRTGGGANTGTVAGQANCDGWTSNDSADNGTGVRLPANWSSPVGYVGVWEAGYSSCSVTWRVWCVRPPQYIYLPLVFKDY